MTKKSKMWLGIGGALAVVAVHDYFAGMAGGGGWVFGSDWLNRLLHPQQYATRAAPFVPANVQTSIGGLL